MYKHLPLCLILTILMLYFASPVAAASPPTPEQQVTQLQKQYQQLHSLEFNFSQTTQNSGRIKQGTGNAVFYRLTDTSSPASTKQGIMRWNYTGALEQTIINDGTTLSIYTPKDKQLIISPAHDLETDITYAIFTGTKKLVDEFIAAQGDASFLLNEPPKDLESVLLTPRQPHPQIKRVQLWFTSSLIIDRLLMEDHFGAMTELKFTNIRLNALQRGNRQKVQLLLQLNTAPGTEIIRQ